MLGKNGKKTCKTISNCEVKIQGLKVTLLNYNKVIYMYMKQKISMYKRSFI